MNTSVNTRPFIPVEQYSQFILTQVKDQLLPTIFYRNVSDFGMGETLNIKTIGAAQIQEVNENVPLTYNPIETGNVTLSITDYIGNAWFITDKLRQDGEQIEQLLAQQGVESARAIAENFETRYLAVLPEAQTATDPNLINGFAHRVGIDGVMTEEAIIEMGLAFDKAQMPTGGRVGLVDPTVAATMQKKLQLTGVANQSQLVQQLGDEFANTFARDHKFVMNIHGFDLWTSNRLPQNAAGTGIDGTVTITNASVNNIFLNLMDDNTKSGMIAWRQMPRAESERNKDLQRDEFLETARFGVGVQRLDSLGVIATDATVS